MRKKFQSDNKSYAAKISLIFLCVFAFLFMAVSASAAPGRIWTTTGGCGDPQNKNHYEVDDEMYIWGSGFPVGTYDWNITGKDGSCDEGVVIASGQVVVAAEGETFCFHAYTILEGDCGGYRPMVAGKSDHYSVLGAPAGTGDLEITKVLEVDATCEGETFPIIITGPAESDDPSEIIRDVECADVGTPFLLSGLELGTYTITEGPVPGWAFGTAFYEVIVQEVFEFGTATLEVTNVVQDAGISIIKDQIGGAELVDSENGWYEIEYRFTVQNTGTMSLWDVQVTDDLADVFSAASDGDVISVSSSGDFGADEWNASFIGGLEIDLLDSGVDLLPGEIGVITVIFRIQILEGDDLEYLNEATAIGYADAEPSEQRDTDTEPTVITLPSTNIPTLSEWGMIIFSLLLAGSAVWMMRRRTNEM